MFELQHVFKMEDINWSCIEFVDNQDVLDLIEKVQSLSTAFIYIFHYFNHRTLKLYLYCRNLVVSLLFLMKLGITIVVLIMSQCRFKMSLFTILFFSTFSMFPKSTHETFANKLYQTFKNHKRFIKPKLSRTDFTVAHYAGEVCIVFVAKPCSYM